MRHSSFIDISLQLHVMRGNKPAVPTASYRSRLRGCALSPDGHRTVAPIGLPAKMRAAPRTQFSRSSRCPWARAPGRASARKQRRIGTIRVAGVSSTSNARRPRRVSRRGTDGTRLEVGKLAAATAARAASQPPARPASAAMNRSGSPPRSARGMIDADDRRCSPVV